MKRYRVLVVNTSDGDNTDNVENLVNIFSNPLIVGERKYTVKVCRYNRIPKDYKSYHLIMLSGRLKKDSPSTSPYIKNYYSWLREYTGPLIAICGGYQRWLQVLGGKLDKVKNIEKDIAIANFNPLYSSYSVPYIYSKHSYFISINNVPRSLDIIAITKGVAVIKSKKYLQFGFQGHPEKALRPLWDIILTDLNFKPIRILYLPIHLLRVYHAYRFAIIFFKNFLDSLDIYYEGWGK